MNRLALFAVLGVVEGCNSDSVATQTVQLASLSFDVPLEWERRDADRRGVSTSEWTPDENGRKESLTIIRTETSPAVAKAGVPALTPLLAASQRSLGGVRSSRVKSVTTTSGMLGARIDVDFVPPGLKDSYHRIHVVLIDDAGALVHVLYTARSPDAKALEIVLDSIRREEA